MKNSYLTSDTIFTSTDNINASSISNQSLDKVRVLFEYFFTTTCSMKDQNKYLILFIQYHVQNNELEILNRLFSDNAIKDLHVSLIKSASIFTSNIDELKDVREDLNDLVRQKLS